ncbi:MAG: hypothetical protein RSE94_12200 [Pseudomonas sp.]
MRTTEEHTPHYAGLLKPFRPIQKVQNPESLLHAHMGSYYPNDSVRQRVFIRFIELTGPDEATIIIRIENDFYSATTTRNLAYANADAFDIFVKDGKFQHVAQKIVYDTDKPVDLHFYDLPPLVPENGATHEIALYAPKNTVIRIPETIDIVIYRVLYHLDNGTSKFVIKTSSGKVFEYTVPDFNPDSKLETFGVPGDFVIYQDSDVVTLVTARTMPYENHLREDSVYIVLPENYK